MCFCAESLIVENGRVSGVKGTMYDGTEVTLHANKGVILATVSGSSFNIVPLLIGVLLIIGVVRWFLRDDSKKYLPQNALETDAVVRRTDGTEAVVEFRNEKEWMCEAKMKVPAGTVLTAGEHVRVRFQKDSYDRVEFARDLKEGGMA